MLYFPEDISYGSTSGVEFNTTIVKTKNGYEQRNTNWSTPLRKYNVLEGARLINKIEDLRKFFISAKGRRELFLYKDWLDYKSSNHMDENITAFDQLLLSGGDGVKTQFQLVKQYVSSQTERTSINITRPKNGTVLAAINNTPTTAFTVNYNTGVITFNTAPISGADITVGYEFYIPCRFASDDLFLNLDTYKIGSSKVDIIEVKE